MFKICISSLPTDIFVLSEIFRQLRDILAGSKVYIALHHTSSLRDTLENLVSWSFFPPQCAETYPVLLDCVLLKSLETPSPGTSRSFLFHTKFIILGNI